MKGNIHYDILKRIINYISDNFTRVLIAVLFTIAYRRKQPKYISADGWILKNVVHTCNRILFNCKRNEIFLMFIYF